MGESFLLEQAAVLLQYMKVFLFFLIHVHDQIHFLVVHVNICNIYLFIFISSLSKILLYPIGIDLSIVVVLFQK